MGFWRVGVRRVLMVFRIFKGFFSIWKGMISILWKAWALGAAEQSWIPKSTSQTASARPLINLQSLKILGNHLKEILGHPLKNSGKYSKHVIGNRLKILWIDWKSLEILQTLYTIATSLLLLVVVVAAAAAVVVVVVAVAALLASSECWPGRGGCAEPINV